MKEHWYGYSVGFLFMLNLVIFILALTLDIPTNCNTCSPDGWCTMRACPLLSDIFATILTLSLVIAIPLLVLLSIIKIAVHLRQKKKTFSND